MPRDEASSYPETLPAHLYSDPDIFAREQEVIFAKHWALVGREEQLQRPGDFIADQIAGKPILVIKGRDGGLRGFHNLCRHRAGPLVRQEAGRCDLLRCVYHGWVYNHEGALVKAHEFEEGPGFEKADFNLFSVRVELWNGLIFAALDESAGSLAAWLGDIVSIAEDFPSLAELSYARELRRCGQANWKAYGDNSVEGYHLPHVHRDLSRDVGGDKVEIAPYEKGQFVGFKVTYANRGKGFWIYKFPGLLLHFSEKAFNIERVTALSHNRVELRRRFWLHKDASDQALEAYQAQIEASDLVMAEDMGICEAVQRNLEAGVYKSGRLSPRAEPGTIYFQQLVRQALGL